MRLPCILLATGLLASTALAQEQAIVTNALPAIVTNRLTLGARLGFNISARFKGTPSGWVVPPNPRTTPSGDPYNYDNGYVLTDSSGNFGGQTWYWGYDNSATYPAGQISDGVAFPGNSILLSRTTPNTSFSSPSKDDTVSPGAELAYTRWLGQIKSASIGVEIAANYQSLSVHNSGTFYGGGTRVTDAYPYAPGTTPPTATPSNPYQGAYGDEGFLIGANPVSSISETISRAYSI